MVDLQSGYNVPGVYVRDTTGPLVTNAGFPESIVTLVGPATGYQQATEVVPLTAAGVALTNKGVWLSQSATGAPAGVKDIKITTLSGAPVRLHVPSTPVVPATDTTPEIPSTPGTPGDYTTTEIFQTSLDNTTRTTIIKIAPLTTQPITPNGSDFQATDNGREVGEQVIVTYYYTDASYYEPLIFEDLDRVEQVYGDALLFERAGDPTTPEIVSPLSFAALVAFSNGATRVICVATDTAGTLSSRLDRAYNKVEGDFRASIIVPILAGGSASAADFTELAARLRSHVEGTSQTGYQRIGILGAPKGLGTAVGDPTPATQASRIGSRRVMLAYPNRLNYFNAGTGHPIEVDGFYLAAAYAARLTANPAQIGLTRQQIFGFSGFPASINRVMTKRYKDDMSAAGVAVCEVDRQNRLVVRHGTSTDNTSVLTREVSITRARDALFDALQIGLDSSGLIGAPIDIEMTTRVKGAVQGILEAALANGTFVSYANLKVRQQSSVTGGDPTVIEVKFSYQPAVPLNYILVSFSLDLQSGSINLTDAA